MLVDPPPAGSAASLHPTLADSGLPAGNEAAPRGTLQDLAAVRLALSGESAVDSARMFFSDRAEIDRFLRLHQFDTDNPLDVSRLKQLHHEATVYLAETHRYRLPRSIEQIDHIHDLFLAASQGSRRQQRFACMTLKVMHTLHHLNCREMIYGLPISEADLLARLNTKVFRAIDELRANGVGVHEFSTGKKTRTSMVTKLLAKRGTMATHIFDKMRFRIIVQSRDDLVMAVVELMRRLVPFNFIVPGQSQNALLTVNDVVRCLGISPDEVRESQGSWSEVFELEPTEATPPNEFSGSTYRCINVVADIPVRLDDVDQNAAPAIGVVQAEIQLMDAKTAVENDEGENAHALYKKRQREVVRRRLEGQRPIEDLSLD